MHFRASKLGFLAAPKQLTTNNGEVIDNWGVQRTIDGPFWPLGLGPLGKYPDLRDGSEWIWDNEKQRKMRENVLSKFTHLFDRKSLLEGVVYASFKEPIVVFDSELSPPLSVRMRKAATLKDEGELIFESRFESGNLRQARRMYILYFSNAFLVERMITSWS